MKTCPLCHKELRSIFTHITNLWQCPTLVREYDQTRGPVISHYSIDGLNDERLFLHPYRVDIFPAEDTMSICIIASEPGSDVYYKRVTSIQTFLFRSEEHLRNRITNLLPFL